jgi:hypothetical protein
MGTIKAKLAEMLPQPVPITVPGFGELLIHPLTLEEQANITNAEQVERNHGKAMVLMLWFTLRKIDPDLTREDVDKMNLGLPENQKLVEEIGKVMAQFSSFRGSSPGQ